MSFFSELASNASTHGVGIVLYSGNNDALAAHRGTEGRPLIRLRNPIRLFPLSSICLHSLLTLDAVIIQVCGNSCSPS
jgi:hypothetical protein